MALSLLEVRNVRNLASVSISPSPHFNLLFGANGSGKTSILEAIHILGLGRSFRTTQARKLVRDNSETATVFGRINLGERVIGVGVQKKNAEPTLIKVDGCVVDSASNLAELLPLQLLTPESHELLQGEPKERRAFMDWGLFHVEHGYLDLWRRYRRVLQQRNAGLRSRLRTADLAQWDKVLAEAGEQIALLRARYLAKLAEDMLPLYERLVGGPVPALSYRRGWSKENPLLDVLVRNRESELSVGHTLAGPHRGDVRLLVQGQDGVDVLSRGQLKLAVCAMRLGQANHLRRSTGQVCTILVDDLPAELDSDRRQRLLAVLAQMDAQCFVTATERELVVDAAWSDRKVFHVEHGAVVEVV